MIRIKHGDLFEYINNIYNDNSNFRKHMIIHQCNCKGVMGKGFAKQIKEKFPKSYKDYIDQYKSDGLNLGDVIYSETSLTTVANICSQYNYAKLYQDKTLFTDYDAFRTCINKCIGHCIINNIKTILIPCYIGCGLANGDWEIICRIFSDIDYILEANQIKCIFFSIDQDIYEVTSINIINKIIDNYKDILDPMALSWSFFEQFRNDIKSTLIRFNLYNENKINIDIYHTDYCFKINIIGEHTQFEFNIEYPKPVKISWD